MNNDTDLVARKRLCGLMRQFAIGRIDSEEFDQAYGGLFLDLDAEIIATETFALNDEVPACLVGPHQLSRADRRQVARWVLFLQSGQDYYELNRSWGAQMREIGNRVTGGLIARGEENEEYDEYAQYLWPFLTQDDLEEARRHPKLLSLKG